MLRRMRLRRYLEALLYHDNVIQGPSCETGFLFVNCDGERPDVLDSPTQQLWENTDGSYEFKKDSITIAFQIESQELTLSPTKVESSNIRFSIDIIANAAGGSARQDMLDQVQEKILYRILSHQTFTDATTGDELKSLMRWLDGNQLNISVTDDTEYDGSTTVRRLTMNVSPNEYIKKTNCGDEPLCFDFSQKIGGCNG